MSERQPWDLTGHGPRRGEGIATTADRLASYAAWFGLDPAPATPDPEEPGALLLDDALLEWMIASGGSLDWFVCGDVRGMAVAFRREELQLRDFAASLKGLDAAELTLMREALESGKTGAALAEALGAFWKRREERRAQAAAKVAAKADAALGAITDAQIAWHMAQVTWLLRERAPEGTTVESVGWRVDDLGKPHDLRAAGWAVRAAAAPRRMAYQPDRAEGWIAGEAPLLDADGQADVHAADVAREGLGA